MKDNWTSKFIGQLTNNLDNKRIPLNKTQRDEKRGDETYPYLGANGEVDRIDDYIFDERIICIAEDGGSWGEGQKCAYIVNEKCWVNNHAHVLTAKNGLSLDYLRYYLNLSDLSKYITGTTRGKLTRGALERIEIPLPPLPEQKRIAEVLDKADALREKRRLALQKLDTLLQSVFLEMFGDPVKNPKDLTKKPLGELIKVKSGAFLPEKSFGKTGNIPVYGGNGISGYHDEYMFDRPMLVIGRVGVYCGAIHLTRAFSWITDNALYISEKSGDLNETYLFYALKQANLNQYAGRFAQPLVSGSRIYPVSIVVPPMNLQNKFAEIIEKIKSLEIKNIDASKKSENLFQSLQQRAFKGELFNDEFPPVEPQEENVWQQTSLF
ncbi:MAG: restriction endonuclease subunit S [Acidobacteriota bacterium]|nr:restriction endonuclease subunit S [Acidobacteriota bacterium]